MSDPRIHPESTDWTDEEVDAFREALVIDQHSEMDLQTDPISEVTTTPASDDTQPATGEQSAKGIANPGPDTCERKTRES